MTDGRQKRRQLPAGLPPRLLTTDQAAAYCGVSREIFERDIPVAAVRALGNRKLWDRAALDRWLDGIMNGTQPVATDEDWLRRLDADADQGR